MKTKTIIIFSILACIVCSFLGYAFLFFGGHLSLANDELNIFSAIGYVFVWPTIIAEQINIELTAGNKVLSQIIGYLIMGFIVGFVTKSLKTHNKAIKKDV